MDEQIKHYIQDEEVEYNDFIKALEVLKDYKISYSFTEECSNEKIFCTLYLCKDSILNIAKVIRELESQIK